MDRFWSIGLGVKFIIGSWDFSLGIEYRGFEIFVCYLGGDYGDLKVRFNLFSYSIDCER